jgi:hypothetical protein
MNTLENNYSNLQQKQKIQKKHIKYAVLGIALVSITAAAVLHFGYDGCTSTVECINHRIFTKFPWIPWEICMRC